MLLFFGSESIVANFFHLMVLICTVFISHFSKCQFVMLLITHKVNLLSMQHIITFKNSLMHLIYLLEFSFVLLIFGRQELKLVLRRKVKYFILRKNLLQNIISDLLLFKWSSHICNAYFFYLFNKTFSKSLFQNVRKFKLLIFL